MPVKKYYCRHLTHMSTTVNVNGKEQRISFENGVRAPKFIPGSLSTGNPALQEAIESHPSFGIKFELKETNSTPDELRERDQVVINKLVPKPISPIVTVPLKVLAPASIKAPEDTPEVPKGLVAESVTNAQQAKDWLVEHLHITYRQVMNKTMILTLAEENKVTFPNWK